MTRYKVLTLPNQFEYELHKIWLYKGIVWKTLSPEEQAEWADRMLDDGGYERIPPVFNRDGWYLDRYNAVCWYEWRGQAWLGDCGRFDFELRILNTRILEPAEVAAIKTLLVYGSGTQELRDRLKWDRQMRLMTAPEPASRKHQWEAKMRFLEFKKRKGFG